MNKIKNNKKGFTLAELLIVVAIIGVLVAVSVPIFKGSLNKAKLATDQANARAAKASAICDYLENAYTGDKTYVYDADNGVVYDEDDSSKPTIKAYGKSSVKGVDGDGYTGTPKDGKYVYVKIDKDSNVTVNWGSIK